MRWWSLVSIAACAGSLALAGCAKPAFTQAVRERYALGPADLQRIQFYTSGDIVLRRELSAQQKSTSGERIVMSDGVVVEEIVIPIRTPGVALRVEGDYILVGFSRERPEQALWFAARKPGEEVMPLDEKRYRLVHLENGANEPGPFEPRFAKGYLITYDGEKYQLVDGKMWDVHLLYDEGGFAHKRLREQAPGWKLSDGLPAPAPSAPAPGERPSGE